MNSITINGNTVTLNEELIAKQDLDGEAVAEVLGLHARKMAVMAGMEEAEDSSLEAYAREITCIEFSLQRAWGFSQNENYHRFWLVPRCLCSDMDNEDRYPTGQYTIAGECPVHGGE